MSKNVFQGAFFLKLWPYVWLVFKSGFKSSAGYDSARTVCNLEKSLYTKFITLQNLPQTSTPVVPDKTPPFLVVSVDNGFNSISFVHLQIGAKKEDYGNLLNNYYDVKNYCDTFIFHFEWKLGHPMICGWNM